MFVCSHYIVPELGPDMKFTYASHKAVDEYKEAKAVSLVVSLKWFLNPYRLLDLWLSKICTLSVQSTLFINFRALPGFKFSSQQYVGDFTVL